MDRKTCLIVVALAALAVAAAHSQAYQIMPSPEPDEPVASPIWPLGDLEKAVQDLRLEFTAQAGSPELAPLPTVESPVVLPVAALNHPISTQCRVITTTVHLCRARVACDDGPDMWYSQGFFQDPTDHKTYRFRFNDMGAAAGGDYAGMFVVVYHPADRELCESDIEALIPTEWVKDQREQAK